MPPPSSTTRNTRASFSTTHHPTSVTRSSRKQTSSYSRNHHDPLSLIGLPWRFLHLTADNGANLPPVLSDAGRQYMVEDAYRWQTQQTTADVVAPIPQLSKVDTRPLKLSAYGDDKTGLNGVEEEEEDDEDDSEEKEIEPLPEFNPFSDTFAVALSPLAHTALLPTTKPSAAAGAANDIAAAEEFGTEEEELPKKKRGMVAADLLSHFAQKEVVDEERERTRQRERSKWDNSPSTTSSANNTQNAGAASNTHNDSGGVMVGGLGLSDESNSARQARVAVDAEEEERRRRLSAAAEEEGLTAADMPDMSDFITLYQDADEPSYPAIVWRQKERLTEAADVPFAVINELNAIDRERMAALTKRSTKSSRGKDSSGSRGAKRGHERKMTLRFNLGLGKDYEEDNEDDDQLTTRNNAATKQQRSKNRFPALVRKPNSHSSNKRTPTPAKAAQAAYGRQWYLPVVQWPIAEEEKERLEAASAEKQQQQQISVEGAESGDTEADGYHGDGWRDKVLALKAEMPQLYCSKAFKAFLLREREKEREARGGSGSRGGRRRMPHYLEGVEALDEKREEEEEKRAIQAAVLAITTPRITHSTTTTTAPTRAQSANTASAGPGSGPLLPLSPRAAAAEDAAVGSGVVVGEEEREGDLLEYMREVRMRELNLAGLRWIKEREKAMEDREKRKKEKERRKARAGGSVIGGLSGGGGGGSEDVGDVDEDGVDLDKLFDVPDYPCSLT